MTPERFAPAWTAAPPFLGDSEMAARMRALDWLQTAIGPPRQWPQTLRTAIGILLTSRFAMWLGWGPELTFFYNDAYAPTLGAKHPWALGRPAREVWAEIWPEIGPRIERVLETGEATWDETLLLFLERRGFAEETYHTFSYSPLRTDDTGAVSGHLCVVSEDTERVIGERRLRLLRELAAALGEARTPQEVFAAAGRCLDAHPHDLPFSLTYLFEEGGKYARLACASGFPTGDPAALPQFEVAAHDRPWPAHRVLDGAASVVVPLDAGLVLPQGPWRRPPREAVLLPIRQPAQATPAGVFIAGLNPHRLFDADYRGFVALVAGQIATAIANARAYEAERRRAEALAEIDRAKTAFFSNASHEFRTPLTLLLSPLEDLLVRHAGETLITAGRAEFELMRRNGLRLLKLVNTLLDFSRIEAGRVQANYQMVDLPDLTADLASTFRSAMERAGLSYRVDCRRLPEPAHVDPDMWEKIVLNLLSNAFKYTLAGEVELRLGPAADGVHAELSVRDTGVGIPPGELPRLFERFHRIEGQEGRSQEGTGIGLALAHELVRIHGGRVIADSVLGRGTTFTVRIPLGTAHLPKHRLVPARRSVASETRAEAYVEEALRWLGEESAGQPIGAGDWLGAPGDDSPETAGPAPLVLLADDNADMRDYLRRLLSRRYRVAAVADGGAALDAARRRRPDLILSDVMMPRLDGFGLLRAVREDPQLREVPVILLSARAGEEALVEGAGAGADDYLIKPFAARELLARVEANLKLARLRRESADTLRARATELETLLETVPAAVWFTSDPDARRMWGNRHAARLLRLGDNENASLSAPATERPRHFRAFRDGIEAEAESLPMQRASRGEEVRGDEIEIRFEDGTWLTLLLQSRPVRDAAGRVCGAICAGIDITSRKQAEAGLRRFSEALEERVAAEIERRREAETALRQAQKMEAIGQLTGGVAHDMNNLLLVIQGNLELVERLLPPTGRRRGGLQQRIDAALRGVERAASLTQRLLAFARRQPLAPRVIDPNQLIAGMSELLRVTLGESIVIEHRVAEECRRIFADPNQLEAAILNLAVNARDAMPGGGKLILRTADVDLAAGDLAALDEVAPGSYVLIAVTDTGAGMSAEVVDKAFEPFFTTKEIGKGTGLGLSQVYGFVRQSGGHVALDSAPGRGTTVRIYLPASALAVEPEETRPVPPPPTEAEPARILVVEDDTDVREYNIGCLSDLGYDVVGAADAAEALGLIERDPRIALLFTDIGLGGGVNGRQLADAARRRRPELRVLFATGYARDAITLNGHVEAGISVIFKPFSRAVLAAELRRALDRSAPRGPFPPQPDQLPAELFPAGGIPT